MLQIRSARDFLQIMFRYRREAVISVIAVAVVFVLGMLIKSPSFSSDARLFVQLGQENQALPSTEKSPGDVLPATPSRDQLLDEQKILLSNDVVTQVAQHFFDLLNQEPASESLWKKIKRNLRKAAGAVITAIKDGMSLIGLRDPRTPIDSIKEDLLRNFEINHDPGSAVLDITFSWEDPVIARDILSVWLTAYRKERDTLQGYGERLEFYERQAGQLKQSIKDSQFELQQRLIDAGSSHIDLKMKAISQNILDVESEKYRAQNELNALLSGIATAKQEMIRTEKNTVMEERSIPNPIKLDRSERLNQLILERESLLSTFLPTSKKIQAMDESIAEMKRMIEQDSDRTVGDRLTQKNPNYIQLESSIQERTIRTEELRNSIASYDKQIADSRAELKSLVNGSIYIKLLETDIQKYEDEYTNYKSGLEKARLEMLLENNLINNVKIMQEPTLNPVRSSLKPLAAIMLLPAVALFVALLTCYLIAMTDQRIYDQSSFSSRNNIRVIDIIPASNGKTDPRYNAAIFRLAVTIKRLAGKADQAIAFAKLNQNRDDTLMADVEQARQRLGADYTLLDAKFLSDTMTSYPIINSADFTIVAVESAKATLPQLLSQLNALQLTFPDKLLGIVLYNRQYEIPDKLFSWISR